jgi:hypothetical protein
MSAAKALQTGGLLLAWASLSRVLQVDGLPHAPAPLGGLTFLTQPGPATLCSLAFAVAAYGYVCNRAADLAMAVMAGLLALGAALQRWQWPGEEGVNGAVMLPGAALVASLLARRLSPAARRDAAGVEAAAGIVAASYVLAGLSKLSTSGWGWTGQPNLGVHILAQGYAGLGALGPLREAVAQSALACRLLGVGTLTIELGAIVFLWPSLRRGWAATAVAMHLGISLLMGLHHYDWLLTVLGVAAEARSWRR